MNLNSYDLLFNNYKINNKFADRVTYPGLLSYTDMRRFAGDLLEKI